MNFSMVHSFKKSIIANFVKEWNIIDLRVFVNSFAHLCRTNRKNYLTEFLPTKMQ